MPGTSCSKTGTRCWCRRSGSSWTRIRSEAPLAADAPGLCRSGFSRELLVAWRRHEKLAAEAAPARALALARPCWRSCAPPSGQGSEEHTSELQSLMRISYAVFCLKKKKHQDHEYHKNQHDN